VNEIARASSQVVYKKKIKLITKNSVNKEKLSDLTFQNKSYYLQMTLNLPQALIKHWNPSFIT
jgi:hypothetical protein